MALRVAINGFGRIGRHVFRAIYPRRDIEVAVINDIAEPQGMEYLLRFDSVRGRFPEPVHVVDGALYAKGRKIPILHGKSPGDTPWYDYGIDVVIEATGRFRTREALEKHLAAGADRVILTTPPRDRLDAVHIGGVSPEPLGREARVVSCGSSTANCAAAMLKVLDEAFGVDQGFFTSIHAYTSEQSLIDVPSAIDLRLSRAANENIVPVGSWTADAIVELFPHLRGRFSGAKLNVPVPDASCVDLTTTLRREVEIAEVNAVFRSAAQSTLKGILDYTDEPIVSSDVTGSPFSCTFDAQQTMLCAGTLVKTMGWYDQGGGLAHRIVDLLCHIALRRASS